MDLASSSSSSSSSLPTRDVFLNFRGEDTRKNFVCHLYEALKRRAVNVYLDNEDLRKGDDLSDLLKAIAESKISIVVFSENYATSTWCLKELVKILECKKGEQKQIVMPIFYRVDPSHIRKQTGSLGEAFAKHERDRKRDKELLQEVQTWRFALKEATNLAGSDSKNYEDDAKLIDDIVNTVFDKVNWISPRREYGLVAMDSHLHQVERLLYAAPDDVVYVGIWGMGGLGKTTIARAVYDKISHQFEHRYFLIRDVREGFMKKGGEVRMQHQFLSGILKVNPNNFDGDYMIVWLERLREKKIIVVLDDVSRSWEIDALLGSLKERSFGCGSIVIVTTRDEQVLGGFSRIYKPNPLSDPDSLELFNQNAFTTMPPSKEYDDVSKRAIEYAHGLPLALQILGAHLRGKRASEWEHVLEKIKNVPNPHIHNVLKISFDGLDATEKNIFLDIACFFKGMHIEYVEFILNSCGFYASSGLRVLINKDLVSFSEFDGLKIHDLLHEIGRDIVRKKPWKHSRLWSYEDVQETIAQNKAMKVEGVMIELADSEDIHVDAEAFVSMVNLRLLRITYPPDVNYHHGSFRKEFEGELWPGHMYRMEHMYRIYSRCKLHLNGDLNCLSQKLRVLAWHGCPLKSLPSKFNPKHLVDLDMRGSHIEQLWPEPKAAKELISIDLSSCKNLKEIPLFTEAPKLQKLILYRCTSLVEVSPSISDLTGLVFLSLYGCTELKILPSSIHMMKSLKTLVLSDCSNLEMFPEISEDVEALSELKLDCTAIKELPSSIVRLRGLKSLNLSGCRNLEMFPEISEDMEALSKLELDRTAIKELPSSIVRLRGLKSLDLSYCKNLEMFPEIFEDMEALTELILVGSAIKELPSSIERLRGLKSLNMNYCRSLVCLPDSICDLADLKHLDLGLCSKLCNLPENLGYLKSLFKLDVMGTGLKRLPVSILHLKIGRLSFLHCKQMEAPLSSWPSSIEVRCTDVVHLDFSYCNLKDLSDSIAYFRSLRELNLSSNKNLTSLPAAMNQLGCLEQLELEGCESLRSIPELSSRISYINAHNCVALEAVSTPQSPYDIVRCFKFGNCHKLVQEDIFRDIVERHSPPQGNCSRPFYFSLPGSKIPEQFNHQWRGTSVTVPLPQNWFDKKFLGFAICAVTNEPQSVDYRCFWSLTDRCFCTFKGEHCEYRFSFYLFNTHFRYRENWLVSNHMLLGYVPWSEFGINGEEVNERSYTEAKFEIELHYEFEESEESEEVAFNPSIERCGVRFFFANNEDEEVAHQDFGEPIVHNSEIRSLDGCLAERSGSDITSDTSDEEEQYLKLSEVFEGANRKPSYIINEDNDSSRKRKTLERWTQEVRPLIEVVTSGLIRGHLYDGFSWDCDGYIENHGGLSCGRYACTHEPGCRARAEMRSFSDNKTILEITYIGRHTCWKTLPMLTHQVRVTPRMGIEGPFDGFTWGEYTQTNIPGAEYPRVYYYVCTPQNVKGCMAIKEVQHSSDKKILKITYRGRHTCIEASDSSSISAGSDASSIHEQVVQSSSSPGANDHGGNEIRVADNPVDEDNVIVSRDASPQDMSNRKEVAAKKSKGEEVAELEVEMTEKKKKKKDKDNDVLDSSDGEKSVKVKKHRDKEEAGSPQTKKSEKKKKKRNKEAEDHGADAATDNGKGDGEADKSERKKNEKKKHKQQEITDSPVPVPAKKSKGEEVAELEVEKTEKKKKKKKKDKDVGVLDFSDGEKSLKVKKHKDNEEAGSPQTEKSEKKKKKRNKEAEYHGADAATDNGKGDGEADKSEKKKNEKKKRKEEEITDSAVTVPAKKSKGEEVAELEVEKTEKKKKKKKKDKHNGVLDSSDGEKSVKVKKHKDKEEAGSPQSEKSEKKKNKEAEDHGADAATDNGKGDCEAYKSEKKKNEKKKRKQEEITDSAVTVPAKKSKSEEVAELEVEKTEKKKKMKKKKKDKDNGVLDSSDGEISVKVKKHKDKEEAGSPQTEKSEKKKKKRNKEAEDHGADAATNNGKGDGEADKSEKKKKKKKDKSDADEE
ncbi:disease resistance protein RUN1-like isoform X1 [Rosa rugosa]|uniref:disease resistance protein RUN1-like isoform X1 n=1 Tax=Rosa rugosa TaxID=74645 RepID=UPI002B40EF11|nr:disease resistance protein RUN1-like isoform X1 [Rosa rugosa]